jgi:hypothetical protein
MRHIFVVLALLTAGSVQAAVVYTYTGNTYDDVYNCCTAPVPTPYDTSMRITGTLVLAEELGSGLNFWGDFEVLSYSFSDGVNTLTNENSSINVFEIIADEQGDILYWDSIRFSYFEDAGNGSVQIKQTIETSNPWNYGSPLDRAINFECLEYAEIYACNDAHDREASIGSLPGTWTKSSVVPIPAAVWLFGSALAGLGWIRRKHTD